MVVNTKVFGTLELEDEKVITFEQGLIGFEFLKKFVVLYQQEDNKSQTISWLQSIEEPELAFPMVDPFLIKEEYNPVIDDERLVPLGNITKENMSVMVTLTVPKDITKMSCNLKAPIVFNTETKRGAQIIAENSDYPVKYYVYDYLSAKKKAKEEC